MQRNSSTETRKASVISTSRTACPELSLNHVAIAAPDPERSMAFYAAFGFRPDFAKRDAAGQITLQQMRRGEFFVELLADQDAMAPGHFGLHTADLDALLQHLDAQGLQPLHPVQRGVSGVLWTFFEDPAGNRVEVTSPCHD
ncbi:VOC family protein [Granulosicoccus sp. 3-233]|uniref:VOC family protein n=1 Tax=Granulosicoccus sp. 3-233 TaxID=3417969 RepID=UPI003D35843B